MDTQTADPAVTTPPGITREAFEAMLARAGEAGVRTYNAAQPPPARQETQETPPSQTASQEQAGMVGGLVDSLDSLGNLGIPFGSVLVGAIPGVVVGELIDGFLPGNRMNPVVKVGAAWAGVQYGRALLGGNGSLFFAGALVLQAAAAVLPIDTWIASLVGMFRRNRVVAEAEQVARQAWMGQAFTPSINKGGVWS